MLSRMGALATHRYWVVCFFPNGAIRKGGEAGLLAAISLGEKRLLCRY